MSRIEGNGEFVVDKDARPAQVGTGSGSIKHAPHWLQQDTPALYFPLAHHVPQGLEERGRKLVADAEVSWGLRGSSKISPSSFYTTVALGSQKQLFNVLIDSYDSLFWVQCAESHSASSTNPVALHKPFNLSSSSSVSEPLCNSSLCSVYNSYDNSSFGCDVANSTTPNSYCQFVSNTESSGHIVKDQILLSLTNGLLQTPNISFGCGSFQSDISPVYDGQLGLGRRDYSFIKQLSANQISADSFSLCLDGGGVLSHLLIGRTTLPTGAIYTPLIGEDKSSYWATNLTEISINGSINVGKEMVFDTSQTLTLFPADLFMEIFSKVNINPTDKPYLLYCSNQSSLITYERLNLLFPKLVLRFASSKSSSVLVDLEVPPANYFTAQYNATTNTTTICLNAILAENSSKIVLGSSWLQNLDILFDEANSRIGWLPTNCTSGKSLTAPGPAQAPDFAFPPSTAPPGDISMEPSKAPSSAPSPSSKMAPPPTSSPDTPPGDTNLPVLALGSPPPPPTPPPPSYGVSQHVKPTYLATLITFSLALTFHYFTT